MNKEHDTYIKNPGNVALETVHGVEVSEDLTEMLSVEHTGAIACSTNIGCKNTSVGVHDWYREVIVLIIFVFFSFWKWYTIKLTLRVGGKSCDSP